MAFSTNALNSLRRFVTVWTQENVTSASLAEIEEVAETIKRVVGQVVVEAALKQATGKKTYRGTSVTCSCASAARFVGYRTRWVKTVAGEAECKRAYYHCRSCARGRLPWDEEQGLDAQVWSPQLKALVAEVCAHVPYGAGVGLLERMGCVRLEESSAEQIVSDVGARLRESEQRKLTHWKETDEESLPAASRAGRLYIGIDAAKAHIDGSWHDVKVATLCEAESGKEGRDHPVRSAYIAAREECDSFGWRVYSEARERGLERFASCVVIGDGAEFIWNQAALHFPRSTQIVDFWHACEHIWSLSRSLYGPESEQGKRWARERISSLKECGPAPLLRALKRRKPASIEAKESLRIETGYFRKNRTRMNYPVYRSSGMMIGSGIVEAGCKIVVGQRLKQSGMRWKNKGADAMLAVRTAVLSKQLDRLKQCARAH